MITLAIVRRARARSPGSARARRAAVAPNPTSAANARSAYCVAHPVGRADRLLTDAARALETIEALARGASTVRTAARCIANAAVGAAVASEANARTVHEEALAAAVGRGW